MVAIQSGILTAQRIIRAANESTLKDRCSIYAPGSESRDDYGDLSTEGASQASDVPCSYGPLTGNEVVTNGSGIDATTDSVLRLPVFTEVPASGWVVVAARGDAPERTFQVKAPLHGSDETITQVLVTER